MPKGVGKFGGERRKIFRIGQRGRIKRVDIGFDGSRGAARVGIEQRLAFSLQQQQRGLGIRGIGGSFAGQSCNGQRFANRDPIGFDPAYLAFGGGVGKGLGAGMIGI
ncbi:MAG: hypothetical protein CVT82_09550 [Alphaproteobacteria bacterium HGW-Alphaproteobacteria-4]|nr:MAG: hypothetical protein CVT82_09550 [Alphaproteobacteria bacterium HGW-Alphaproteobacteria-4]